ncbi:hypothetical protein T440DRAFT_504784 [Plenodomus tracheiphilus IPT5]|uniref:Uncharacterized protein n=1 Tax=Plenodomus tracheiphilus IPT5 TaxID=1408161 RepID=A0A6A7BGA2_9PLEO|nr:hypothetical protein T440DRAFT_504784 [Plenodomus tracheiphilus IPT5]
MILPSLEEASEAGLPLTNGLLILVAWSRDHVVASSMVPLTSSLRRPYHIQPKGTTTKVMFTLRNHMRKLSQKALNKIKPSGSPHNTAPTSLTSVPEQPASGLQLPRDPKLVRRDLHDSAPSYLPAPTASREEVQYFIYAVLTTKVFGCGKACPQWVLETCWDWENTGEGFLALTDEEIMTLCPMRSKMYVLADADQKRWNIEQMPSPHARELIGKAILAVLKDRRKSRSSQKDQIQRHWDAERFRDRLNHGPMNSLHRNPPTSSGWMGQGQSSTRAVEAERPWYSRESSYVSEQKRGSGQSSEHTKSTAGTTPTVSDGSSAGHHDQDVVSKRLPDFSGTAAKLSNVRRAGSLRVRGSAPVLRAKEAFRPSTMRCRPAQLSELFEDEPGPSVTQKHRRLAQAPSLCVEIPNGHISMDFGLPIFQSHLFNTNSAPLSSRGNSQPGSASAASPPSPRGSPRRSISSNLYLLQQNAPSQSQSDAATHRAWLLRNSIRAPSDMHMGALQPSIGIEIGHSPILGPQYSPGTAIQFPLFGVVPPQNVQPPSVLMSPTTSDFDTTTTRHWPPHRVIFPCSSQSALPSINTTLDLASPDGAGPSSSTGGLSPKSTTAAAPIPAARD